jgi:hypothetical protein
MCLYLFVEEGWSYQEIAAAIGCVDMTVIRDVKDAKRVLSEQVECCGYPFVEDFFALWRSGEQHSMPRYAALRHERLAQDLEQRITQRSQELADVSECMGANCPMSHTRSKGQAWTHWESRYLNKTGHTAVPESLFAAKKSGARPSHYCAADPSICDLGCAGCRGPLERA